MYNATIILRSLSLQNILKYISTSLDSYLAIIRQLDCKIWPIFETLNLKLLIYFSCQYHPTLFKYHPFSRDKIAIFTLIVIELINMNAHDKSESIW